MKTAILLSGQYRTGSYCFPSIKHFVLDRIGEYDVFAHIADDQDSAGIAEYKPKALQTVVQPFLDEKNYIHRTGRQVFGVQQVLRQLWSLEQSYRMVESTLDSYDWVIRLRADTQFFTPIESLTSLIQNGVYIPKFCNWWGYNDRFALMRPEWASAYHCRFSRLDKYIEEGGVFHPETNLKYELDRVNTPLHRTSVMFDTVRSNLQRVTPEYYETCGDVMP